MALDIASLRENYTKGSLDKSDVFVSPFLQFEKWFNEALESQIKEPNAMVLATVSSENKPSSRVVLLKGFDSGFNFFTNYKSRKGEELFQNPNACLNFFWNELERQVRIEGVVEKLSDSESDAYFHSRPISSQIGAIASNQSEIIESRRFLEEKESELLLHIQNKNIDRPTHWGGYKLIPNYFEFWQGRPSRLHDRIAYTLQSDNTWQIDRLSP
ncbi:MAG: pyridoxamine 5'-phosphate oxidase [Pseudarcicella sp.]|nr:pyridoxamine 5'-phosphate oxidase [Pseudarcicella sp.]